MVSVKTEIALVKLFRLVLPTAFLAISLWSFELGAEGQQALLRSLGQSANHILFITALAITVVLYMFMGAYERRIFYEARHANAKGLFMKRIDD